MSTPQDKRSVKTDALLSRVADRFFVDNRCVVLTLILIVAAGSVAFLSLPRFEDPPLTQRAVTITTLLPGATPEQVEASVTEVIEDRLLTIPQMKRLRSQSRSGASWIVFEVDDRVEDTSAVWSRIASKLEECRSELPPGASSPSMQDFEIGSYAWIGAITTTSDDAQPPYPLLRREALRLQARLRAIPGTKSVDLACEPKDEILIELDLAKASSLGIQAADVSRALASADAKESPGLSYGEDAEVVLEMGGHFTSIEDIAETPIRSSRTGTLRIRDIARIERRAKHPLASAAVVDGKPAVVVAARIQPEVQVRLWNTEVHRSLEAFQTTLPAECGLTPLLVQEKYVSARMDQLIWNLALGASAVCLVTLLLMGWGAALIVTLALPLVSCMVLFGMQACGIPMHQMSVTGLVLALGMLIDNAIIAVDETAQSLSLKNRRAALRQVIGRLSIPLFGSTLTTALAFWPLATMPGPTGEFVGTIGLVVILSIFSSLLLALTVLPALAARYLPQKSHGSKDWFASGLRWQPLTDAYRRVISTCLRRPQLGIVAGLTLPVLGFATAGLLSQQFFPPADRDQFQVEIELGSLASLERTREVSQKAEDCILEMLEVEQISWFLGRVRPPFITT